MSNEPSSTTSSLLKSDFETIFKRKSFYRNLGGICTCMMSLSLAIAPCQALDRNAAYGIGLGLGLLGGALAAQQRMQMQYSNMPPPYRRRLVNATPRPMSHLHVANVPTNTLNVATNAQLDARVYWNCRTPYGMNGISAHATYGFIKEGYSTRFVCGNARQPVKVFTYMSPVEYVGSDEVEYVEKGRVVFIDKLNVGNYRMPLPLRTSIDVREGEDTQLTGFDGCEKIATQAKAQYGFTAVHENRSPDSTCKGHYRFFQSVVYHAVSSFRGTDHVDLLSSARSPITFDIQVYGSTASDNALVSRNADKVQDLSGDRPTPVLAGNGSIAALNEQSVSLAGVSLGESVDAVNLPGSALQGETDLGETTARKWTLANTDDVSVTYDKQTKRVLYIEIDWSEGEKRRAFGASNINFGVTKLSEIRSDYGSNGFSWEGHMLTEVAGGSYALFNSYGINQDENAIITFTSTMNVDQVAQFKRKKTDLGEAKVVAVSLASASYLKTIWGKQLEPDNGYRTISWTPTVEDFPAGSPAAVVSAMAHEEMDPGTNEQKHKAYRNAYFSAALQAYENHMKPDDWQDFDADDFTGTQDLTGVTVKSVSPTKRGNDIEIIVSYGNDDAKNEHGKPYPPFKVGYIMVQDVKSAWKIDDVIYDKIEGVTPERSFRAMYAHP